jgi:hypothetical protein
MKKIALILLFVAFGGFLFTSCTEDETCKQCKIVKTNNVTNQSTVVSTEEKCGDDLINTENEAPVTVGDETTKWECN